MAQPRPGARPRRYAGLASAGADVIAVEISLFCNAEFTSCKAGESRELTLSISLHLGILPPAGKQLRRGTSYRCIWRQRCRRLRPGLVHRTTFRTGKTVKKGPGYVAPRIVLVSASTLEARKPLWLTGCHVHTRYTEMRRPSVPKLNHHPGECQGPASRRSTAAPPENASCRGRVETAHTCGMTRAEHSRESRCRQATKWPSRTRLGMTLRA